MEKPDPVGCIAVTLEYVRSIREPVYQDPRLLRNDFTPCQNKSGRAGMAREKRNAERGIFEEMSRYYRLVGESEEGDGVRDGGDDGCIWVWDRPALVKQVLEDLKVRHPPPGPQVDANLAP